MLFRSVDRKGAENPVGDNLPRLENIPDDPIHVNDSFPDEQLYAIKVNTRENPWYVDYANFIVSNFCLQALLINRIKIIL